MDAMRCNCYELFQPSIPGVLESLYTPAFCSYWRDKISKISHLSTIRATSVSIEQRRQHSTSVETRADGTRTFSRLVVVAAGCKRCRSLNGCCYGLPSRRIWDRWLRRGAWAECEIEPPGTAAKAIRDDRGGVCHRLRCETLPAWNLPSLGLPPSPGCPQLNRSGAIAQAHALTTAGGPRRWTLIGALLHCRRPRIPPHTTWAR